MTTARRRRSSYSFWIRKINHSSNSRYVVFVVIKRVTQWCDWCEYLEMWEDKTDVSHYSQPVSVMKRKSQESQAVIQVDRMSATCFCSLTNPSKEKTTLGLLTKSKDIVLKHNIQSIDRDFKEKCVIRSSEQLSKRIQRNHRKNRGICSDSFTFWTYLSTIGSCQATIIKEREKKRNCQETNFICSIFFLARKTKHFFDFLNNKWKRRVRMNCHEKFISIEVVHWISWNSRRMSGNSFEKKNGRFFSNTNFSLSLVRDHSFEFLSSWHWQCNRLHHLIHRAFPLVNERLVQLLPIHPTVLIRNSLSIGVVHRLRPIEPKPLMRTYKKHFVDFVNNEW